MTVRRPIRSVAWFALVIIFVTVSGPALAMPSNDNATLNSIKTQPGRVQFLFTANSLPAGATLDPSSVVVSAAGKALQATAVNADAATSSTSTPIREVILTLDVSGSMRGDGIAAAKSAAIAYARSLPRDVRVGLVTFSDRPTLLLSPTTSRDALGIAIGKVGAGGGTALYDGLLAAADQLAGLPPSAERRLLLLSDGDDTSSTHTLAAAQVALARTRVAVDVVAFRLPGNRAALDSLARASNGRVLPAGSAAALAKAFATAATAFRQQLLVTVTVPNELANSRQTLEVTANAGGQTLVARAAVEFPAAADLGSRMAGRGATLVTSAPAARTSSATLWLILSLVFGGMFGVALVALFLPRMGRTRAQKMARLAEVHRYRVVGVVGATDPSRAAVTSAAPTALTQRTLALVDRTVRSRGQRDRLVTEIDRAGLRMRPEEWIVVQLLAVVFGGIVLALVAGSIFGLIIGAALGWAGARVFLSVKTSRRSAAFADQLPDTLQLLAGSLRSGFSLGQALNGVVREGTEPAASEFARALTEVRLGAELEDALDDVAGRMRSDDLRWVIMAVRISREVGGNLAEVLGNTITTMRQRAELRGQVRVLSAEGRTSAKVLIALPFLLFFFMLFLRPGYLSPLIHTGTGILMLIAGIVFLSLGAFWLSRLVKIEV